MVKKKAALVRRLIFITLPDRPRRAFTWAPLPAATFDGLMGAPSMGKFFNANIKGSGSDGPYDCRTHRVPKV